MNREMRESRSNPVDDPVRGRILEGAARLFLRSGFHKVTTNELAGELGVSKKTIYRHFRSKDELVERVMESMMLDMESAIERIVASDADYARKLSMFLRMMGERVANASKTFLSDIRRHRPELWARMQAFRRDHVLRAVGSLLCQGAELGVLRPDVDRELFVLAYLGSVEAVMNPEVLSRSAFSAETAFGTIIRIFFDGMLVDSARERFRAVLASDAEADPSPGGAL